MPLKKKKVTISRKSFNWKALLFTVLAVGIGGYVLYSNMATPPSINKVVSNGLDPEEAAFLQKSIAKDKPAAIGTAPAPVVKVTVKDPGSDNEVTSTVVLNKVEEKNDDGVVTNSIAQQITAEVLAKGIVTNTEGTVVGGGYNAATGQGGVNRVGDAVTAPVTTTTTTTGGTTCATAGSPVLSGTWVSTGTVYDPTDPAATTDGQGRTCVKCGDKGYEGNMDCRDVVAQGLPFVLPRGGGVNYTGTKEPISSCFADIGKGTYVQVGVGQSTKDKGSDMYCSPTGNLVSSITKLTEEMKSMCSAIGKEASNGKCEAKAPVIPANQGSNGGQAGDKPCVAPLVKTADGQCRSQASLDAANATDEKAKKDAAAKALAAKELALPQAKKSFGFKSECDKALLGTSTLECYPTGPIGSQTFAIRTKSATSTTYIACPMVSETAKDAMVDSKKGCGSVSGTIAAAAALNIKNANGNFVGGEGVVAADLGKCRFGGSPNTLTTSISNDYICNDYSGKVPSNSNILPNKSENKVFKDTIGTNGFLNTAVSQCNAQVTPGYECVPNGFDGYKLTKIKDLVPNSPAKKQDGGQQTDNPADCEGGTQDAPYGSSKKYLCKNSDGTTFNIQQAMADSIASTPNSQNANNGGSNVPAKKQDGGQQVDSLDKCGKVGGIEAPYTGGFLCNNSDGSTFDIQKAMADSTIEQATTQQIPDKTPISPVLKSTGTGALWGAGAGVVFCVGGGLLTGPLAIAAIPACLVSIGAATTAVGGIVGLGVGVANTPPTPTPAIEYSQDDLKSVVKDAAPLSLQRGTLTDDASKCENNGYNVSQNWGGSAAIGYVVYQCN